MAYLNKKDKQSLFSVGTSAESLPEETVTSPVSPATSPTNSDTGEVWDEAKVSLTIVTIHGR